MDTDEQKQLRRYNTGIITCGKGIMIFGFWSFIKVAIGTLLIGSATLRLNIANSEDIPMWLYRLLLFLVVVIFSGVTFAFHWIFGRMVVRAGNEKGRKRLYLLVAIVYLFMLFSALTAYFYPDVEDDIDIPEIEAETQVSDNSAKTEEPDMIDIGLSKTEITDALDESMITGDDEDDTRDDEDDAAMEDEDGAGDKEEERDPSEAFLDYNSSIVAFGGDLMFAVILIDLIITSIRREKLLKRSA